MELEDFRCDLLALRKLYGLLLGGEDLLQDSDMDERAMLMLKNLLDDATEKVFKTHLKMREIKQSGFSNPSSPSKADQFNAGEQFLVPVSGNLSKSSPNVLLNSSENMNFHPLTSHPNLKKLSPELPGLGSISSNKLQNRKNPCQLCNQSSMKLRNRVEVLGRDGDSQEQPRDELCTIDRISEHSKALLDKTQKGTEPYKNNRRQIHGNPGNVNSVAGHSISVGYVKPRYNLDAQVEKNADESQNDFAKEVAFAIKRIESGISALQLSSGYSDVSRTSIAHKSNSVPKERVLVGSRQIQAHQRLSKSRDDLVSLLMSPKEELQMKKSCQTPSKIVHKSRASKSAMQESETRSQVPGLNVKAIVDSLESFSRPGNQTSESHQYVQGLRVPPSQNEGAKRPPPSPSVRIASRNFKGHAVRNRTADEESTTHPVKSRPSMPRKSVGSTVSVRHNLRNKFQEDSVRNWMADTESKTKTVKSRPSMPPKSVRSVVSRTHNQRNKLQHQAILRPTLLDHRTSIPYHYTTDRHERPLPPTQELEESTSGDLSSSSRLYSSWTSQETTTANSGSEAESASQTRSSRRFDPESRWSSNGTSGSSSEDSIASNLGPMNKMGPVARHGPTDLANPRKATGRLRRFKNKLGLIFHHHHHHHHHVEGDDGGHTTSMWNNFQGIFHHKSKPKVYEKQAVGKVRNAAAKEQVGHFHALVDGLLRHTRHTKKSRPSKGGIQGLGNRRTRKKLHWWQKKLKRSKGVKLPNRGRAKIRMKQLKSNKTSKQKLLTHK